MEPIKVDIYGNPVEEQPKETPKQKGKKENKEE